MSSVRPAVEYNRGKVRFLFGASNPAAVEETNMNLFTAGLSGGDGSAP